MADEQCKLTIKTYGIIYRIVRSSLRIKSQVIIMKMPWNNKHQNVLIETNPHCKEYVSEITM